MSARDLYSHVNRVISLAPAVRAADATGTAVDCRGYSSVTLELDVAAGGITFDATNKIEAILEHSDDNSTFTAVAAADVRGPVAWATGGIIKSFIVAHTAQSYKFGYYGQKRYVRPKLDYSGTHGTGTGTSAAILLGHPHLAPVA